MAEFQAPMAGWSERATAVERGRVHVDLVSHMADGEYAHEGLWTRDGRPDTVTGTALVAEVVADLFAYAIDNGANLLDLLNALKDQDAVYDAFRTAEEGSAV